MNDKERLKDIKTRGANGYLTMYTTDKNTKIYGEDKLGEDVNWLIEQAERAEELEDSKKIVKEQMSQYFYTSQKYCEALESISDLEHIEKSLNKEVVEVARQTLEESE